MARKKRREGDRPEEDAPELPSPREAERLLRELERRLRGEIDLETPQGRAQALVDKAYRASDPQRQARLARKALAVCPDCTDAYVLLAELSPSRKESLDLYRQGVAAGERALGPEVFERSAGHFWGVLETRPYMRARLGLAHALWNVARREEAADHLTDMLRLNPNDNQGVRYSLAGFLLLLDRDDNLARLLEQFAHDDMAAWAYTRALLAFRRHGDTPDARALLTAAQKKNRHVPPYLTGEKWPPPGEPGCYSPGHESEALVYVRGFLAGWKSTPGAVAWMRANDEERAKRKAADPRPRGPLGFIRKWVKEHLPQSGDVWEVAFRRAANWLKVGEEPVRPWLFVVRDRAGEHAVTQRVIVEPPSPAWAWDVLLEAMQRPREGQPRRPAELWAAPGPPWDELRPHLEDIGVRLRPAEALEEVEAVLADTSEMLTGKPRPGLLDMPGVRPEQVASFHEAAALYYESAPWKRVGDQMAIKVEWERSQSGPWYAVVMGQSGLTLGLALYDELKALKRLWSGDGADEDSARRAVGTSVIFGEEWTTSPADFEAAVRHGWKVARPEAYPDVFHKERGLSRRPPLAWELELVEGCLRTVPAFVARRGPDDEAREEMTVPTGAGGLKLYLSWVV
jgi:hypothetical protein